VSVVRILLIDDNDSTRRVIRRMLSDGGFGDVREATNGKDGLAFYRQEPRELVITDILMPDGDGLGVILEVRRYNPAVKVIAISGGGQFGAKGIWNPPAFGGRSDSGKAVYERRTINGCPRSARRRRRRLGFTWGSALT
jgi:chemotaxis response regulator CheB